MKQQFLEDEMLIPNIFGLKVGLEFEISSNRIIKEVESRCKNYLNDRGMFFVHDRSVPVTKTELNFAKPFQIYLKDIISEENLRRRKLLALLSDIFHENKKGRHYKQEGGHVHVNINWFFVKRVWGSALFFKLCLTRFLSPYHLLQEENQEKLYGRPFNGYCKFIRGRKILRCDRYHHVNFEKGTLELRGFTTHFPLLTKLRIAWIIHFLVHKKFSLARFFAEKFQLVDYFDWLQIEKVKKLFPDFTKIIDKINQLSDFTLIVSGDTYIIKENLKSLQFIYNPSSRTWQRKFSLRRRSLSEELAVFLKLTDLILKYPRRNFFLKIN